MNKAVLCIGGAVIDRKYRLAAPLVPGTSNPATLQTMHGGVARNIAETLARLGAPVALVSRIGMDAAGDELQVALSGCGVDVSWLQHDDDLPTADYIAVLDATGNLLHGLAAMQVLARIEPPSVDALRRAGLVVADCNLSADALAALVAACRDAQVPLAIDAVSTAKVMRLPDDLSGIDYLFLNTDEAAALTGVTVSNRDDTHAAHHALARRGVSASLITAGAAGISIHEGGDTRVLDAPPADVVDVTGAGDALVAGTIFGLHTGMPLVDAAGIGMEIASRTLQSSASVAPDLSPALAAELLAERADEGPMVRDGAFSASSP